MSSTLGPPPPLDPRYAAALAKQKAERAEREARQKTPRRRPILRIVGGTDYETPDTAQEQTDETNPR